MKIIYLDESAINLNNDMEYNALLAIGDFICHPYTPTETEAIERAKDAQCIVVNKMPMTARLISELPALKHIAVTATGYNNVDLKACADAGISVSNVPGYSTHSVVQHIFAMILNLANRISDYQQDIARGDWHKSKTFTLLNYPTFELKGKTIGIIGFGAIGKEVALLAEAFGMKILVNRKSSQLVGKYTFASVEQIYVQSDIVTINCPLTADNRYMIDASAFKMMKPTALLINTARGPLVNQTDLAVALNEGWIGGAGIDVLDEEPPRNNPLLSTVKNLVLTPHSAWSTIEARQRLMDEVALNIAAFKKGEKRNWVN